MKTLQITESNYRIMSDQHYCCSEFMFRYYCQNCDEFMGCYFCEFDDTEKHDCEGNK